MKTALVTTTINVPVLLKDYVKDIKQQGYSDVEVIVIGDKKTPIETEKFCDNLAKTTQFKISYYSPAAQDEYLKKYRELANFLPWNCIQRRNLAILMAYEQGAEVIITIDDDNYLAHTDYIGGHSKVGCVSRLNVITADNGWYNVCEPLVEAQGRKFYHRGYPILERGKKNCVIKESSKEGRVIVNAGFWLEDPDVDAVTRLACPVDVIGYSRNDNFALDIGTWAPFNSQNTALHRDCIPAYFLCSNIGRFDDIWASYMVKKVADHLHDYISFGFPLVKQARNPHDLWVDADQERFGMQLTDIFCEWLRKVQLNGNNYFDCTAELIGGLKSKLDDSILSYQHRAYINHFVDGYRMWLKTVRRAIAA